MAIWWYGLYTFRPVHGLEGGCLAAASLRPFHCVRPCSAAIVHNLLCLFSTKQSPTQFNFLVLTHSTLKIDNSSMWPTSCPQNKQQKRNVRVACKRADNRLHCFMSTRSLGPNWRRRWHRTEGGLFLIKYFKLPYQNLWTFQHITATVYCAALPATDIMWWYKMRRKPGLLSVVEA